MIVDGGYICWIPYNFVCIRQKKCKFTSDIRQNFC